MELYEDEGPPVVLFYVARRFRSGHPDDDEVRPSEIEVNFLRDFIIVRDCHVQCGV